MNEGIGWNEIPEGGSERDAEVRALIPAYALGATDRAEAAAVEALMARVPDAAAELASYGPLQSALLFGAPRVAPPPALEARLRSAIEPPAQRAEAATTARRGQAAPQPGGRRWFGPATRPAWALAGMALALLVATNLWWGAQTGALRLAQAEAEVSRAAAATAHATAEAEIAEYSRMLAALAAGQAKTAMLPAAAAPATADTHAMVIWKPGGKSAMVMAEQFPPLKPGRVYQIWLLHGEDRMSGGMFDVDETGAGMVMVESPMPLDALDGMGITMEPAGGSAAPTGTPIVRGTI